MNDGPTGVDAPAALITRLSQIPRWLLVVIPMALAAIAYSSGLAVGFVSDDFNWLRHAAHGQLGWVDSFRLDPHSNSLPFEIALYHLKFVLFGFNATGYHVFALAGHLANVLLVYLLAGRIGLSRRVAYLGALLAAVMAAGAQAVYWMSGDPHVWATLLTLSALVLYIDNRRQGGWWRYAAAVLLAVVAPLVKAEGVGVIGGVLAFELFWRRPAGLTWKIAPFVLAPVPFVLWEWTTQDQLQGHRGFGLNVLSGAFGYLNKILLPLDPTHYFMATGGRLHVTLVALGVVLYLEGAALALLVIMALRRRETYGILLLAIAGTAPALVVTLGIQSRYVYFAGLLWALVAAVGAWALYELLRSRWSSTLGTAVAVTALMAICACQLVMTYQESAALRAAQVEAQAFLSAVLRDHPSVPDGAAICLLDTPLDTGSATGVFADPRLGPNVGIPNVTQCGSLTAIPAGGWAYEREADGTYRQVR